MSLQGHFNLSEAIFTSQFSILSVHILQTQKEKKLNNFFKIVSISALTLNRL